MSGMDDFASSEECLSAVGVENADLLADCNGDPRLVLQQISLSLKRQARRLKARALMGSLGGEYAIFRGAVVARGLICSGSRTVWCN